MATEEFPRKQMETLWAPWRVEYFEKEPHDRNFLEAAARASNDAEHFVITRRKNSFLMMNRYPYAVGHLMAVPYRKAAELSSLGENEVVEIWNLVVHARGQVFSIICIFISCRAGVVIRISCRSSPEHGSFRKACTPFMTN